MTTLEHVSNGVTSGARPAGHAARLQRLHARAMDLEIAGRATAADCVWDAVHDEIDRQSSASDARLVLDAHLACHHAWLAKQQLRAWRHLDYARRLCGRPGLQLEESRRQLGPLTASEIERRRERGEWDIALQLAIDLVNTHPDVPRYHDVLAQTRCESALARLEGKDSGRARRRNIRRLVSSLHALKKARIERPHTLSIFEAIARLHVAHAEALSGGGLLAESLVEAEAALTYWPDVPGGAALRTRLEGEMQQLRVQSAAKPDAPMGRGRRARFLEQQAAKGFRLVEAFRRSDEVRSAAEDLPIAGGRRLWETIGLHPLEAIDLRPLALDDAIQSVMAMAPIQSDIAACWQRVSEDNEYLRVLDGERVCAYISHRLFGTPFTPAPADVAPAAVAPVALHVDSPVRSREPFWLWLTSPRHLPVKLLILLAIGLTAAASVLGVRELRARQVRTEAFAALQKARSEGRHEAVLDAAERFLSAAALGRDWRVAEVEAAYSTALVRWFHDTAPSGADADRRLDRYRQLLGVTQDAQTQGER
jgi:hypothetical protein